METNLKSTYTLQSIWKNVVRKTPSAVLAFGGAAVGATVAGYIGNELAGNFGTWAGSIVGGFGGGIGTGYVPKHSSETWNSFNSSAPEHLTRENRQLIGSTLISAGVAAITIYTFTK